MSFNTGGGSTGAQTAGFGNVDGGGRSGSPTLSGRSTISPASQQPQEQFTQKEREVLDNVKYKMTVARRLGVVTGAGVGYAIVSRRTPPAPLGTRFVYTLIGALSGGALLMPLGMFLGRKDIGQIEDQDHFKRAVITAVEAKRAGRQPPPLVGGAQQQQDVNGSFPSLPSDDPTSSRSRAPQQKEVGWADNGFDTSVLYQDNGAREASQQAGNANSYPYASTSSPSNTSGGSFQGGQQQQTQQSTSRWDQVRGARSAPASSWERVRQQNAQQVYNQRNASGSGGTSGGGGGGYAERQEGYGGDGGGSTPMADPTFGKGVTPARAQYQREYEASFDRERRGVDG